MRAAVVAVCLLLVSAGCVVEDRGTETPTPSTPERMEATAETPVQPTTPSSSVYDVDVATLERLVHEKMNDRRREHGLEPLNRSSKLDAIARYKSWDMAQRDYFEHRGPDGITHSILRSKYNSTCTNDGQNILKHPDGVERSSIKSGEFENWAAETVDTLMNSTGHRKNILNPEYELQGIGIFVDENGTVYLTQEFCG